MWAVAYSAFFLANTASFLHTTTRGKFLEWDRIRLWWGNPFAGTTLLTAGKASA